MKFVTKRSDWSTCFSVCLQVLYAKRIGSATRYGGLGRGWGLEDCQGWNGREQRSKVINRIILWTVYCTTSENR